MSTKTETTNQNPSVIKIDASNSIFSKPSVDGKKGGGTDGLHRKPSALDAGYTLYQSGQLSMIVDPATGTTTVELNNDVYIIVTTNLIEAALTSPLTEKQDLKEFFSRLSRGFGTKGQESYQAEEVQPDLLDTYPALRTFGITRLAKMSGKGQRLYVAEMPNPAKTDIDLLVSAGFAVHGIAYDSTDIFSPRAIGFKVELPNKL
jgi:hypothetical protein